MQRLSHTVVRVGALLALGLSCITSPAMAATLETWDLTTPLATLDLEGNRGYEFDTLVGGPQDLVANLEVYAFSDWNPTESADRSTLRYSNVFSNADGLGACNPNEDRVFFIFPLDCELQFLGGANDRPVDNLTERDWLLMYLPGEALNEWQSIQLEAANTLDMAISYWIGTINSPASLNNIAYSGLGGLGFGARTDVAANVSNAPLTIDFTAMPAGQNVGNALLIGADFNGASDGFYASGVTALVPLPPAAWLFGSGLLGLFARRRTGVSVGS